MRSLSGTKMMCSKLIAPRSFFAKRTEAAGGALIILSYDSDQGEDFRHCQWARGVSNQGQRIAGS